MRINLRTTKQLSIERDIAIYYKDTWNAGVIKLIYTIISRNQVYTTT